MTKANPDVAPKVFSLVAPFDHGGVKYDKLTLRRPKLKDTRILSDKAEADPVGAMAEFIAQLSQVPPGAIEELDLDDFSKIKEWVSGFTKLIEK
jgi:hypothetical protein